MKTRPKTIRPKSRQRRTPPTPVLRFSPTAWAKLLYLRDVGETEIGGFGLSRPGALLDIDEFVLLPQTTSPTTVAFDDLAIAEFFEDQVLLGRQPAEFARIWIHTHPGRCPQPSGTDEATFARVFGQCDWAVMFILARGGASYARLAWNVGPAGAIEIPVAVDYSRPFPGRDHAAWQAEYDCCVVPLIGDFFDFDFWPVPTPLSCVRRMPPIPHSRSLKTPGVTAHVD